MQRQLFGFAFVFLTVFVSAAAQGTAATTSAYAQTPDGLSGTASSSSADWVEFHRDNMQRWNPYETLLGVGNAGRLQSKWGTMLDNQGFEVGATSSPAVVN